MTQLMKQAIERLKAVPEPLQDRLAQFLLLELDDDDRWTASTAKHVDALGGLAEKILADDAHGECEPLDVEKL